MTRNAKLESVWVTRRASSSNGPSWVVPSVSAPDVQRRGTEAGFGVQAVEAVLEAGRTEDADAPARPPPAEVVAEGDEVDEMVGVEVADDHRLERRRIDQAGQPRK